MSNCLSTQRSIELTKKAEDFLIFKENYLNHLLSNKPLCSKEKILKYLGATEDDWHDWHWQLNNRITETGQLKDLFHISIYQEHEICDVGQKFRWAITPYYLSQIRYFDKRDPIFLLSIPQKEELDTNGQKDPMDEENTNPAGSITRRYPDRVIFNITNNCASFCRHCQRRRNIREKDIVASNKTIIESLEYIKNHPEIRDVLITGGDPLTLEDEQIEFLIKKLRSIKSVEIIRIGTRIPVTLPQRITKNLVNILKKYGPIYINTQFNHPQELTSEAKSACLKLSDNGIILGNQMVFLKNINDDYYMLQLLNQLLLINKVKPYYIFHPKDVLGTKHFSIPISTGIEIYNKLRGNTSGLAIPMYVYNAPKGLGKIPLSAQILETADFANNVSLKTWEEKEIFININEA